jgi:hypothetical protein
VPTDAVEAVSAAITAAFASRDLTPPRSFAVTAGAPARRER